MLSGRPFSQSCFYISVPPNTPTIIDESGSEARNVVGPYMVGDTVVLKCIAFGGKDSGTICWRMVYKKNFYQDHFSLKVCQSEINNTIWYNTNASWFPCSENISETAFCSLGHCLVFFQPLAHQISSFKGIIHL